MREVYERPYAVLAAKILERAVLDATEPVIELGRKSAWEIKVMRDSARRFLESDWAEALADAVGVDIDHLRAHVRKVGA